MAIFETVPNTNAHFLTYMACAQEAIRIEVPTPEVELEFCHCEIECAKEFLVFADLSNSDSRFNDQSTFLYRKLVASDTVTIKLFKDKQELATITDDTYGTYYAEGTWSNTTEQALYIGFLLDWNKVLTAEGTGLYQIQTETTILGTTSTISSVEYRLYPFSEEIADGTIRMEWTQNGNILSNPFDFTGMNWYNQIRIDGRFGNKQPTFETDQYLTSNRRRSQIQDNIVNSYSLETELIPSTLSNEIIYNGLLGNSIMISDYNIWNNEVFNALELYPEEIEDAVYFSKNTNGKFVIRFTDRLNNILKRNF